MQEDGDGEVIERHAGVEILLRAPAAETAGDEVELDFVLSHIGRCGQSDDEEERVAHIEPHAEGAVNIDQHQRGEGQEAEQLRPAGEEPHGQEADVDELVARREVATVKVDHGQDGGRGGEARFVAEEDLDHMAVDGVSQPDGDEVKGEEEGEIAENFFLVFRQFRPQRVDAEEGHVRLDLDQEIHRDALHRVAPDDEGIDEIEDENADHEEEAAVESPCA